MDKAARKQQVDNIINIKYLYIETNLKVNFFLKQKNPQKSIHYIDSNQGRKYTFAIDLSEQKKTAKAAR